MRAALQYAPHDLRVVEIPEPSPGVGEVKVKIAYCGVCGSDHEIHKGTFSLMKKPKWPKSPFSRGHEISGIIVELGEGLLLGYEIGQRVAISPFSSCGGCYYCRNKMPHYCEHISFRECGFQEYAVYHESAVYPLPEQVSLQCGALLEPLAVALHAVDAANILPGKTVAITGGGSIGLLSLLVALRAGAARVMVSEPSPSKRRLAEELGADWTVDPFADDVVQIGRELTDGRGYDTVIEASGSLTAARQCLELAGICGTVVWAGVYPEEIELSVNLFHMWQKELTTRSIFASPYTFTRALNLLTKLNLEPLISEVIPLENIARVFASHDTNTGVKSLIQMWPDICVH